MGKVEVKTKEQIMQELTTARCSAYQKLHELSWSLHNAPLHLIEKPERITKKIEEALALCEESHEELRKARSK